MVRFASVVVGFACFAATNAWAQGSTDKPVPGSSQGTRTNDAKAAALRAEGEELIKADDCKGALDPLRSAWALREDGKTAVLLGECELRVGLEPEAAQHLARALELLPEGAERTRVESMFQDVSSRVARLDIVVNEAGAVVVVGKFVVDTPVEDLFVPPGDIEVTVNHFDFRCVVRLFDCAASFLDHDGLLAINDSSASSTSPPAFLLPLQWLLQVKPIHDSYPLPYRPHIHFAAA